MRFFCNSCLPELTTAPPPDTGRYQDLRTPSATHFRRTHPDLSMPPTMPDPTAPSQPPPPPPTAAPPSFYGVIPPPWLLGLLISWLAFGTLLAMGLLMAQFPDAFNGWSWYTGRVLADKEDEGEGEGVKGVGRREMGVSSAVAPGVVRRGLGGGADGAFRLRKPRGLSVDTGDRRKGLGILMPGRSEAKVEAVDREKRVKKRVSFKPPSTKDPDSEGHAKQALTAPLPHRKTFMAPSSDDDDGPISRTTDIETGHHTPLAARDLSDQYYIDSKPSTPYFSPTDALARADAEEAEKAGWLGFVNRGVYGVADRLADVFYDKVVSAEEGLVLPVREEEREGWMGRRVD